MSDDAFRRRVAVAIGLVLVTGALCLLLWYALQLVLLTFAGVLLAVLLNGLADLVCERTGVHYGPSLGIVGIVLVALLGGLGWLVGPDLANQIAFMVERLPSAMADVGDYLQQQPWGREFLARMPFETDGRAGGGGDLVGRITGLFSTTLGVVANVLIVLFLGIYMAVEPGLYRDGALRLVPKGARGRAGEVADAVGHALRRWLAGRFASMGVIAALSAVALLILGVPLVLGLSAIAGLLSFVPMVGPLAAAVPAMLVAWGSAGPMLALWVAVAYTAVQALESYLITPLIQRRAVSMPPALLLAAQILMGLAAGIMGLLMAAPATVVVVVLVQTLYEQDTLDEDVQPMGTA